MADTLFYLSSILENDVKDRTSLKRDKYKLANDDSNSNWLVTWLHAENQFYLPPYYNCKVICAYTCSGMYKISALECEGFGQQ